MTDSQEDEQDPIIDSSVELENGIFNLVVSLCMHKSQTMPLPVAQTQVAEYLDGISKGLKQVAEQSENPEE